MARLTLEGVTKRFGSKTAVDQVSLTLESGRFLALLGPSGCGKTTLLRLIAGFEAPDAGTLHFDDDLIAGPGHSVPPEHRGVGMVFQAYALWPHMTVAENVGYALKVRGLGKAERQRIVTDCLEQVGLEALAGRRPDALSGGQRQRVALARCLAMNPRVVLLDEPLANLDAHLRETMQREFRRFHRRTGATMVYVTHDQAEAMALADEVAVMADGVVQQLAPPLDLYHRPTTEMVARFVGRGMLLPVDAAEPIPAAPGRWRVHVLGTVQEVAGPAEGRAKTAGIGANGHAYSLCLRAEGLALCENGAGSGSGAGVLSGVVRDAVFHGDHHAVDVELDGLPDPLLRLRLTTPPPAEGTAVTVRIVGGWLVAG